MKSGILPIYKPEGISSAKAVSVVKKQAGIKKVGHMGTLDPFATGLLLCGIDKGTRISRFFLGGSKRYKAKICLGIETDTFDCTGQIKNKAESDRLDKISKDQVLEVVNMFKGKQKQVPPSYSALKYKGKPLYKYAREGKNIIKPARPIEVFEIAIRKIELAPVYSVYIDVLCSAGTYIRTIAYDIGKKLGCGAHLAALERTETCGFTLDDALDWHDLEDMEQTVLEQKITSLSDALSFMPAHNADEQLENKIRFGQKIDLDDGLSIYEGFLRILTKKGDLAAIVEYDKKIDEFKYSCVFIN